MTPQPAIHLCHRCNGSGREPGSRYDGLCERCEGKGDTYLFECGHCCEEYDLREEFHYFAGGEKRPTPRRVAYTVGPHAYEYCSDCAPAAAIGNGLILSELLRQITEVRANLQAAANLGPYHCGTPIGTAIGVSEYLELNIRNLMEWCGVEAEK